MSGMHRSKVFFNTKFRFMHVRKREAKKIKSKCIMPIVFLFSFICFHVLRFLIILNDFIISFLYK